LEIFYFLEELRFVFGSKFVNPNKPSLLEFFSFTKKKQLSFQVIFRKGGGVPIRYFVTHFVQAAFGPKN